MRKHVVPVLLVLCTLSVAFWIVAARFSSRSFKPFALTGADLASFQPELEGGTLRVLPMTTVDPAEPNIASYIIDQEGRPGLGIRVVHGYNMPMCMKIKGYTVAPVTNGIPGGADRPVQVWRVVSSTGDTSIWVTTMLRSGDFAATTEDVCSMAFPRVDIPDDPRWVPRGVTRESLKHPIEGIRTWVRARWNASRTDWMTFLRLRQPAWASEEWITYVSRCLGPVTPATEPEVIHDVVAGHLTVLKELQAWRKLNPIPPTSHVLISTKPATSVPVHRVKEGRPDRLLPER